MGMHAGGKRGIKSDINVTPLVDVVLVLLIIFMVITPMLQEGKDVNLPKARSVATEEEARPGAPEVEPLVIALTADERIFVGRDEYDEDGLRRELEAELLRAPSRKVLLKGDRALAFEPVRKVMDVARRAGAKGVALAVETEKDGPGAAP